MAYGFVKSLPTIHPAARNIIRPSIAQPKINIKGRLINRIMDSVPGIVATEKTKNPYNNPFFVAFLGFNPLLTVRYTTEKIKPVKKFNTADNKKKDVPGGPSFGIIIELQTGKNSSNI